MAVNSVADLSLNSEEEYQVVQPLVAWNDHEYTTLLLKIYLVNVMKHFGGLVQFGCFSEQYVVRLPLPFWNVVNSLSPHPNSFVASVNESLERGAARRDHHTDSAARFSTVRAAQGPQSYLCVDGLIPQE